MSEETAEPSSDAPAADAPSQDDLDLMESLEGDDNPDLPAEGDEDPSSEAAPGEGTPAEPAAEAAEDVPGGEAPVEIDPYLLERAQEHGIPFDEASALGQKGLSQTLRILDRRQSKQAEAEPPPPSPEEQKAAEEDARLREKYKLEYPEKDEEGNEIEYNPHTRKALEAMNEHYHELNQRQQTALDASNARLDAMDERAAREYAIELQNDFDGEVNALGADYEELLGKGGFQDLDENSVAFHNRGKVLKEIGVMDYARQIKGVPAPPMKERVNQAVNSLFPVNAETKATRTVGKKVKKMGSQLSVPPTTRKTAPKAVSGEELANQHLRVKISEAGGDPGPQEKEEDGLGLE